MDRETDQEWVAKAADGGIDPEELLSAEGDREDAAGRTSPSWRGLAIAVIAAIVLSVSATLLLGGSFFQDGGASAAGCGPGSACCPPAAQEK